MNKTTLIINSQTHGGVERTTIDGREAIKITSYTLPYNIVMKDILYPKDEIERAYKELDETPAPIGHPTLNGQLISAKSMQGYIRNFHGVYNSNPTIEGNRVKVDKIIDVNRAKQSDEGRELLKRIEAYESGKGEPISTSVGLFLHKDEAPQGKEYKWIARDIELDHDAILLNEAPAADPTKGVGALIGNSKNNVEVITMNTKQFETNNENATEKAEPSTNGFWDSFFKAFATNSKQEPKEETQVSDKKAEGNADQSKEIAEIKKAIETLSGRVGELAKKVEGKKDTEANHIDKAIKDFYGKDFDVNSLSNEQKETIYAKIGNSQKVPEPKEPEANSKGNEFDSPDNLLID